MNKKDTSAYSGAVIGLVIGILMTIVVIALDDIIYRLDIVLGSLFIIIALPVIEEGLKYLPLESSLFKRNYIFVGLMIGLGFGLTESFVYVYYFLNQLGGILLAYRISATLLHIATGGLMGYFVSKRKGFIGLLLAIAFHILFNLLIELK